MNNFKAKVSGSQDISGKDSYATLQILGLEPKTVYAVFLSLSSELEGYTLTTLKNDTVAMIVETLDPKTYNYSPLITSTVAIMGVFCIFNLI